MRGNPNSVNEGRRWSVFGTRASLPVPGETLAANSASSTKQLVGESPPPLEKRLNYLRDCKTEVGRLVGVTQHDEELS